MKRNSIRDAWFVAAARCKMIKRLRLEGLRLFDYWMATLRLLSLEGVVSPLLQDQKQSNSKLLTSTKDLQASTVMKLLMLLFVSVTAAVSLTACKPDAKDLEFVQKHESSNAHRYYDEYEAERIYNLDPQGWHQKRLQSERDTEAFFKYYSNRRVVPGQGSAQSGLRDSLSQ